MFIEIGVVRNFTKLTGKNLCQTLFFNNNVACLRLATLLKKRLWHKCFPVNFVKFLRIPCLQNTAGHLFLLLVKNFNSEFSKGIHDILQVFRIHDQLYLMTNRVNLHESKFSPILWADLSVLFQVYHKTILKHLFQVMFI